MSIFYRFCEKQTYHHVILSIAKDLYASTKAFQILHFVQKDKNQIKTRNYELRF